MQLRRLVLKGTIMWETRPVQASNWETCGAQHAIQHTKPDPGLDSQNRVRELACCAVPLGTATCAQGPLMGI